LKNILLKVEVAQIPTSFMVNPNHRSQMISGLRKWFCEKVHCNVVLCGCKLRSILEPLCWLQIPLAEITFPFITGRFSVPNLKFSCAENYLYMDGKNKVLETVQDLNTFWKGDYLCLQCFQESSVCQPQRWIPSHLSFSRCTAASLVYIVLICTPAFAQEAAW